MTASEKNEALSKVILVHCSTYSTGQESQNRIGFLEDVCTNYELTISDSKTEAMLFDVKRIIMEYRLKSRRGVRMKIFVLFILRM